jgi:hypothetical protein
MDELNLQLLPLPLSLEVTSELDKSVGAVSLGEDGGGAAAADVLGSASPPGPLAEAPAFERF